LLVACHMQASPVVVQHMWVLCKI